MRPNQVLACSTTYPLLDEVQTISLLATIDRYLLTPRGLRTLAPDSVDYTGFYEGDEMARSLSTHEGSIRPWLLVPYLAIKLKLYGADYLDEAKGIIDSFREDFTEYGIGTVAELYEGNPPYRPKGAISFAVNVAAVLCMIEAVETAEAEL